MKNLYIKYKELINYIIFGVATTAVNYVVYAFFTVVMPLNYQVANLIAWFLSVVFAYLTNKYFVFASKSWDLSIIIKEITSFFAARIFSLGVEAVILYIGITLMDGNSLVVKLIDNVIIVIINYVFSKLFIFKKE
ncbi:membrane protein [Companilactobacillus sp. RD055328]|uniref:GtrA family protein n=1 Tax=Companilactobacillus sp. RD055328 TaxID=2916634 RepID=UPI001FC7BF6A|nr:GtrA family protein [Companilactobacillus sp. RD055328]GKQ43390.1 membrane protein [Companilactobacillus sp. RD055328]